MFVSFHGKIHPLFFLFRVWILLYGNRKYRTWCTKQAARSKQTTKSNWLGYNIMYEYIWGIDISEELILNQNHGEEATTTNARYGECSICIMDFKCKDRICQPKPCRHEYHFNCLHKWLEMKDTCPCCRQNVFKDLESESEQVVNREPNETILRVSL